MKGQSTIVATIVGMVVGMIVGLTTIVISYNIFNTLLNETTPMNTTASLNIQNVIPLDTFFFFFLLVAPLIPIVILANSLSKNRHRRRKKYNSYRQYIEEPISETTPKRKITVYSKDKANQIIKYEESRGNKTNLKEDGKKFIITI